MIEKNIRVLVAEKLAALAAYFFVLMFAQYIIGNQIILFAVVNSIFEVLQAGKKQKNPSQ